jgi:hypothetical protein
MKVRFFPDITLAFLTLLGVLALALEEWRAREPTALIVFLQSHGLWHIWSELRWQYMYSHEVLHFLSGVFGSILGCWIYFAFQKRRT